MEPTTASEADIERYLQHLEEDRGLLPRTLSGYRQELVQLVRRNVPLSAEPLTQFVRTSAEGMVLLPTTRNHRLVILRGFLRWLVEHGRLSGDPSAAIRHARIPKKQRTALSVDELRRVVAAIREHPASWRRTRDETLVLLMFYSGLRVAEVLGLNVDQVDVLGRAIRDVRRKGGEVVDVPVSLASAELLEAWLAVRPPAASGALFCAGDGKRLSARAVQKRLGALGVRACLSGRTNPHAFRHSHATALLRVGIPTEVIRQSLNHDSIETTARYLHGDEELLRAALERLPRVDVPRKPEDQG